MFNPIGTFSLKALVVGRVVLFFLAMMQLISCAPSPEQYAAASATVMRAQNVATQDAQVNTAHATADSASAYATAILAKSNADGLSTVTLSQAGGTRVSIEKQAESTATVQPSANGAAIAKNKSDSVRTWVLVLGLFMAIGVFAGTGLAINAVVRKHANTLERDATGQLPAYVQNGQVIDVSRSTVPVTGVRPEEWLYTLGRIYEFWRTHKLPVSQAGIVGNDTELNPDQMLEAMRITALAPTAAATFQPGNLREDREERIGTANQLGLVAGMQTGGAIPPSRILIVAPDALNSLANGTTEIQPPLLIDQPATTSDQVVPLSEDKSQRFGPPPDSPVSQVWNEAS